MPWSVWPSFLALVTIHCFEGCPVNSEVRICRRTQPHTLLQIIETSVSICSLPTHVQTPTDHIRVVHQAEKQYHQQLLSLLWTAQLLSLELLTTTFHCPLQTHEGTITCCSLSWKNYDIHCTSSAWSIIHFFPLSFFPSINWQCQYTKGINSCYYYDTY